MPPGKKSEKGSTVAGNGKGATRFGPARPATTDAVRERARRGTLESKNSSTRALPGQETRRKGILTNFDEFCDEDSSKVEVRQKFDE